MGGYPYTMPKIKAIKLPKSAITRRRRRNPELMVMPKPDNIDPKIPNFSVQGLYLQGVAVDSKLEWHIAMALEDLEIGYKYQVPVFGGRTVGGAMIDFEAFTVPINTFIWGQGGYWHTVGNKEDEDRMMMERVKSATGKQSIEVWEREALTIPMTIKTLKEKLSL